MGRTYSDHGILIKTQDYKDGDKIITMITRDHGLITAIAIGARRSGSRKSPHLDLMSHSQIQIRGIDTLFISEAVSLTEFSTLKKDFKKITTVMSIFEVITQLVPDSVEDKQLYLSTLNYLIDANSQKKHQDFMNNTIKFSKYLIRHLGYSETRLNSSPSISSYFEHLMNRRLISKEIV